MSQINKGIDKIENWFANAFSGITNSTKPISTGINSTTLNSTTISRDDEVEPDLDDSLTMII